VSWRVLSRLDHIIEGSEVQLADQLPQHTSSMALRQQRVQAVLAELELIALRFS